MNDRITLIVMENVAPLGPVSEIVIHTADGSQHRYQFEAYEASPDGMTETYRIAPPGKFLPPGAREIDPEEEIARLIERRAGGAE